MRVMCTYAGDQEGEDPVEIGSTYTVIRIVEWWEVMGSEENKKYYELEERQNGRVYWEGLFSPLDQLNITEEIEIENYQEIFEYA